MKRKRNGDYPSKNKFYIIKYIFLVVLTIFMLIMGPILIWRCIKHYEKLETSKIAFKMPYRGYFDSFILDIEEENIDNSEEEYVEEDNTEETEETSWDNVGSESGEVEEEYVEPVEYSETFETSTYETRMTSFWADDGSGTGECTGSGLCSWDFGVDEHGWYTYNGKLVVATATTYLANQGWAVADGVHLYKYYEELVLTIDGVEYDAIILDSCGSSMKTDRVDLFVSGGWAVKDTMIQVRRK